MDRFDFYPTRGPIVDDDFLDEVDMTRNLLFQGHWNLCAIISFCLQFIFEKHDAKRTI